MISARVSILLVIVLVVPAFGQDPYEAVIVGLPGGCATMPIQGPRARFLPWEPGRDVPLVAAVAAAPGGRLFAATDGTGVQIAELRPDGTLTPLSENVPGWQALNLVVDRTGKSYVLAHECVPRCSASFNDAILTFDALGNPGPIHVLGFGFTDYMFHYGGMDLAADQCTIFLAQRFEIESRTVIRRFNVCTGSFLPDFATVPNRVITSMRVLPHGGLLAAGMRYTAAGTIAQTYSTTTNGGIGLIEGGSKAWIAQQCSRLSDWVELDLATGNVTRKGTSGMAVPSSMVPYYGWSAALPTFHSANVPSASTVSLALLGALLSFVAYLRLR